MKKITEAAQSWCFPALMTVSCLIVIGVFAPAANAEDGGFGGSFGGEYLGSGDSFGGGYCCSGGSFGGEYIGYGDSFGGSFDSYGDYFGGGAYGYGDSFGGGSYGFGDSFGGDYSGYGDSFGGDCYDCSKTYDYCDYCYKDSYGATYYSSYNPPKYSTPSYPTPSYPSYPKYPSYPTPVYPKPTPTPPAPPVVVSTGTPTLNVKNDNNNTNINNINVSATAVAVAPLVRATPVPQPAPYCTITISNMYGVGYGYGGQATLTWNSTNATSATINPYIGSVPTSGSRPVAAVGNQVYSMTVWGPGGTATCQTQAYAPIYTPPVNPAPYVALSQIPYTGFDFGPVGNALYWLSLVGIAIAGAYFVVYYLPTRVLRSAARPAYAATVLPALPVVNEAAPRKIGVSTSLRNTIDSMVFSSAGITIKRA